MTHFPLSLPPFPHAAASYQLQLQQPVKLMAGYPRGGDTQNNPFSKTQTHIPRVPVFASESMRTRVYSGDSMRTRVYSGDVGLKIKTRVLGVPPPRGNRAIKV